MRKEWITSQVVQLLIERGLDKSNAKWCAARAYEHYQGKICNSRDPFGEIANYAGLLAETRSITYKHKQFKPKPKPRAKRPPEAFNFGI